LIHKNYYLGGTMNTLPETFATVMGHLKEMLQSEMVLGEARFLPEHQLTIIPISKMQFAYGIGSGGKSDQNGAGTGGGAKVEPIGALVIRGDKVQLLPFAPQQRGNLWEYVAENIPSILQSLDSIFNQKKK